MEFPVHVTSEIGQLRRIAIHVPDDGINHIPPRMMKTLLYDDIVDIERMRWEYYQYLEVLYWFLDPKVASQIPKTDQLLSKQKVFDPFSEDYLVSEKIIDIQHALCSILKDDRIKQKVIASVCGLEGVHLKTAEELEELTHRQLARTLITGLRDSSEEDNPSYIFPPLPNLIFTRDTAVSIKDHLLLTKPAERARQRESLLLQFVARYHFFADHSKDRMIFLNDASCLFHSDNRPTIEGGDVMMIAPSHLLVGLSARSNVEAIEILIAQLFEKKLLDKVSVINIPKARDFMHIDTIFTHIKRDLWVIFGPLSRKGHESKLAASQIGCLKEDWEKPAVTIKQLRRLKNNRIETVSYDFLEDLCEDITRQDFACRRGANFIYCAGGEALFDEREQWTDGCNFLSLKEGLIIGYDRNKKTTEDLKRHDFKVIKAQNFNKQMQQGASLDDLIHGDTLILLPSAELSRARGGSHCMSLPLLRDLWEV